MYVHTTSPTGAVQLVADGSAPFNAEPGLRERVPGRWLGADARETVTQIQRLLG